MGKTKEREEWRNGTMEKNEEMEEWRTVEKRNEWG